MKELPGEWLAVGSSLVLVVYWTCIATVLFGGINFWTDKCKFDKSTYNTGLGSSGHILYTQLKHMS